MNDNYLTEWYWRQGRKTEAPDPTEKYHIITTSINNALCGVYWDGYPRHVSGYLEDYLSNKPGSIPPTPCLDCLRKLAEVDFRAACILSQLEEPTNEKT